MYGESSGQRNVQCCDSALVLNRDNVGDTGGTWMEETVENQYGQITT